MSGLLWFLLGLFIGVNLGVLIVAILKMAKDE